MIMNESTREAILAKHNIAMFGVAKRGDLYISTDRKTGEFVVKKAGYTTHGNVTILKEK